MEEDSEGYSRRGLKIIIIVVIVLMIFILAVFYWKDVIRYIESRLNLRFFVE